MLDIQLRPEKYLTAEDVGSLVGSGEHLVEGPALYCWGFTRSAPPLIVNPQHKKFTSTMTKPDALARARC